MCQTMAKGIVVGTGWAAHWLRDQHWITSAQVKTWKILELLGCPNEVHCYGTSQLLKAESLLIVRRALQVIQVLI